MNSGPREDATPSLRSWISRRGFLRSAGELVAASGFAAVALPSQAGAHSGTQQSSPNEQDVVKLPPLSAETETPEKTPGPFEALPQRTGYAIVGLGHLSLGQILPAFGKSKYSKAVALVSVIGRRR